MFLISAQNIRIASVYVFSQSMFISGNKKDNVYITLQTPVLLHNKRTNGPVNAHLLSGPSISIKSNLKWPNLTLSFH